MECCCCGSSQFSYQAVLWQGLIDEWRISPYEADYVNRQQGYHCTICQSNMRSMVLAKAIMRCFGYIGLFKDFVQDAAYQRLKVLEINSAGNLTQFLEKMPEHTLKFYPEVDMLALAYSDESFDLVVHSDTLEHVEFPVRGLAECHRVLKPVGFCTFTVPIIVDRLTCSRVGLPASYHSGDATNQHLVWSEFGANTWTQVIQAGFEECRIISINYPVAQALVGVK